MKMYGERFLNRKIKTEVDGKTETRDAIVIDIDRAKSTCRVKMQGSNEYIIAYFSELRSMSPSWLKPGAAVRIAHKGGIRGYVDVIGAGQTVPTGINTKPEQQVLAVDAVLSGCSIALPTTRRDAFGVDKGILWVTTGMYRVSNTVKSLLPIRAKNNTLKMLNRPIIGQIAAQFILNKPTNGKYLAGRVLLNKTTGQITCPTQSGLNPVTPVCPDTCLDLGCFLYSYYDAEFNECCLNIEYQKPIPLYFTVTGSVVLDFETDKIPIIVEVKDQYGNSIMDSFGWAVGVTLSAGTGSLSLDGVITKKTIDSLIKGLNFIFYYHRDKTKTEKPPTMKLSVAGVIGAQEYKLFLLDANGKIIE